MEKSNLDILWIIVAAALVFLMQAGFACLESGLTRSKNSINVAVKNISDLGIAVMLFWAFGFAFMFGVGWKGVVGLSHWFTPIENEPYLAAFFLFQAMFCATAATIVSGSIAERMRFGSYVFITVLISGLIYPIFGHWVWGGAFNTATPGFLQAIGFVDFAGSSVVHSVGGWVALAAILVIGPRQGRFPKDGPAQKIHGHDLPIAILGAIILWFGWFGFNGGSTLSMDSTVPRIVTNTALAAAAGMVSAGIVGIPIKKMADVSLPINGSLAGLVAITANCHAVSSQEAVIIGAVGAVVMLATETVLEKLRIDDVIGAIPVHLAAGIWGTLAVGIFGDPAILGTSLGKWQQIKVQLIGIGVCGAWAFGVGFIALWIGNKISGLRVSAYEEHIGLNVSEHGASTEILELFRAMDAQAGSGDLRLRAPVEPFTEVGQIASRYNRVMETLETNVREKEEILNNDLLRSVREGLFIIKPNGTVGPQYSQSLTTILEREHPEGESIRNILADILPADKTAAFDDFLDLALGGAHNESMLAKLNPLAEVRATFAAGQDLSKAKHLQFSFQPVRDSGKVKHLMAVVSDVSREKELAKTLEEEEQKNRSQMERVFSIIHVEPAMLATFIREVEDQLTHIGTTLRTASGDLRRHLSEIYRAMHNIKGNASLLNIRFIAESAHAFEERIEELQAIDELQAADFLRLLPPLREIHIQHEEVRSFVSRLLAFKEGFENENAPELLIESIESTVKEMAIELGKQARVSFRNFNPKQVPPHLRSFVRDTLVQFIRNSLAHGIELPEERRQNGKPPEGLIELAMRTVDYQLELMFSDDGAGIQTGKLRDRLIASGRLTAAEAEGLSDAQLARTIFESGVSTANGSDLHGGRGVGMDLIRSRVREMGGRISASFRPGQFTRFRILLPSEGGK